MEGGDIGGVVEAVEALQLNSVPVTEEQVEAQVDAAPRVVGKRCFIGNLAWGTSWQDLKDKFRECGNVVYANVMRDDNNRSKGWGIVEFENVEEALAAVSTLNGVELDGRNILVREDREDKDIKSTREPREPREPRAPREGGRGGRGGRGGGRGPAREKIGESSGMQIVVQGIPWSYTWTELKDLFADCPGLDKADVAFGYDGRSRGYGTVRFTSPEAAQAAIAQWNEQELESRTLAVFLDKFA